MRARITVQSAATSTNAFGEVTRTWSSTAIGNLYAQVETPQGSERFRGGAERVEYPVVFRIRYRSDITEKDHRILWPAASTADTYDIESVVNLESMGKITEIRGVKRS